MAAHGGASAGDATGASGERPLVVVTEHLDDASVAWLAERCEVQRCTHDDPRFPGLLARASGLVVRTYTKVNAGLLAGAPMLRAVGRAGVGVDNIDAAACAARGVRVVYTPEANADAVAELAIACLLDALRPRVYVDQPLAREQWNELRRELTAPRELRELTLGVLGMGRIGRRVARIAGAFGTRVLYHDVVDVPERERWGATPVSMPELCERSDAISVHVSGDEHNRGLVSADAFGRMRSGVIFLNTSRGMVVDPHACAAFFTSHPGAQAFLDVHEPEPFDERYLLLGIPNVHLLPHIGGATRAAQRAMSDVVHDVWRVISGEEPRHEWTP
ncbi:MAG: NAD(P)-dependent oxidoreductase [Phycisphaerales bacterium]|jgi:phosphoglycerate dehydrogenase-like enzyme|nr:NAD(P)-dependent oxidoreductase [Phycisphaerales bacterium]